MPSTQSVQSISAGTIQLKIITVILQVKWLLQDKFLIFNDHLFWFARLFVPRLQSNFFLKTWWKLGSSCLRASSSVINLVLSTGWVCKYVIKIKILNRKLTISNCVWSNKHSPDDIIFTRCLLRGFILENGNGTSVLSGRTFNANKLTNVHWN